MSASAPSRSPRIAAEAATAGVLVAVCAIALSRIPVAASLGAVIATTIAYLLLAALSIALALIDIRVHRLPNLLVLPAYPLLTALLVIACLAGAEWTAFARAAVGGLVLLAFYALLALLPSGGMGGGDVKLAGVLGIALGWVGWPALLVGAVTAFLLGGLYGVVLVVARRASRRTAIPFGPWMLLGAWIGIGWGEEAAQVALFAGALG